MPGSFGDEGPAVLDPKLGGEAEPARWHFCARQPIADTTSGNLLLPIGLGLGGGALGALAGGGVGAELGRSCESVGCALGYVFLGAAVGETVGLSSGVYLGTKRQGSYLLTMVAGTLGTVVGVGVASVTDAGPEALVVGGGVQLALTIPTARDGD